MTDFNNAVRLLNLDETRLGFLNINSVGGALMYARFFQQDLRGIKSLADELMIDWQKVSKEFHESFKKVFPAEKEAYLLVNSVSQALIVPEEVFTESLNLSQFLHENSLTYQRIQTINPMALAGSIVYLNLKWFNQNNYPTTIFEHESGLKIKNTLNKLKQKRVLRYINNEYKPLSTSLNMV